jgi:aryl-alcohol dehydrogenase-like predicted oxidoreductase
MQNHYNLLYREEEREMLPLCQAEGIGVLPWSPLARGRLTRARDDQANSKRMPTDEYGKTLYVGAVEADHRVIDRVGVVAAARGIPRAQIALAWLLGKPVVTSPIVGATKLEHLQDAAAAVEVKLSAEEIRALEEFYVPHTVAGFV